MSSRNKLEDFKRSNRPAPVVAVVASPHADALCMKVCGKDTVAAFQAHGCITQMNKGVGGTAYSMGLLHGRALAHPTTRALTGLTTPCTALQCRYGRPPSIRSGCTKSTCGSVGDGTWRLWTAQLGSRISSGACWSSRISNYDSILLLRAHSAQSTTRRILRNTGKPSVRCFGSRCTRRRTIR